MKKLRKAMSNLSRRRHDYYATMAAGSKEGKVDLRINTGGYHCPGSNKK